MTGKSNELVSNNYFLKPGYVVVPTNPTVISTVVGSSISVSIYDRKRGVGGMNHFQFPYIRDRKRTTPQYGNVATLALIRMLLDDGSKTKNLEAQIFGGAYSCKFCSKNIGIENSMIARKILTGQRVRIVSEDIGGERGRKIVFNSKSNETVVIKVEKLRKSDWYPYNPDR